MWLWDLESWPQVQNQRRTARIHDDYHGSGIQGAAILESEIAPIVPESNNCHDSRTQDSCCYQFNGRYLLKTVRKQKQKNLRRQWRNSPKMAVSCTRIQSQENKFIGWIKSGYKSGMVSLLDSNPTCEFTPHKCNQRNTRLLVGSALVIKRRKWLVFHRKWKRCARIFTMVTSWSPQSSRRGPFFQPNLHWRHHLWDAASSCAPIWCRQGWRTCRLLSFVKMAGKRESETRCIALWKFKRLSSSASLSFPALFSLCWKMGKGMLWHLSSSSGNLKPALELDNHVSRQEF